MVWKYSMRKCIFQSTFFTTQDGKKYLVEKHVSNGLEMCENASKRIFNHSRR